MKTISTNKLWLIIIGISSFVILSICLYIIISIPTLSPKNKVIMILLIQLSSGFFFPITIGKIIQLIRDQNISNVLWNFISDCGNAGLSRFYASREGKAKENLEKRFDRHKKGDILLTGPSLRLFFAPSSHFYNVIERNLSNYEKHDVNIRMINASASNNVSLPIRSFVEEFTAEGVHPKGNKRGSLPWQEHNFDWTHNMDSSDGFSFENFYNHFYKDYGRSECRCIDDLSSVRHGIHALNANRQESLIHARETICEPYFTAVIFPDVCFYTPNILNSTAPANMPMLVFHRGGPVYDKLLAHFKFLWWSGTPIVSDIY